MTKKVLVAGASGLVGYAAIRHFAGTPGWDVVGVSRRVPTGLGGATLLPVDLMDRARSAEVFGAMADVTHLVYAALSETPGLYAGWLDEENIERNGEMLRNLFDPLAAAATGLEHVSLLHGTKAYGLHHPSIGMQGVRIPLRERDPRLEHRNFYFVQEQYLQEKQAGKAWRLTTFRPTVIYGDAPGNNMNPIPAIAAYASILRERGEPLHFPGRPGPPVLREAVDADLVARAIGWAATTRAADGEAFNLTNGDVFMWENVWPAIAETLGMETGESRPTILAEELPRWGEEWKAIVRKYDLLAAPDVLEFVGYNSAVYTDGMLGSRLASPVPALNSTIKARQAGFHDCMDTEDMFRKWFRHLQVARMIPPT
ncbi:MAG: NAD-dependent epimerase/dehydratase family protein [Dehalococcoidia bacterium]